MWLKVHFLYGPLVSSNVSLANVELKYANADFYEEMYPDICEVQTYHDKLRQPQGAVLSTFHVSIKTSCGKSETPVSWKGDFTWTLQQR